MVLEKDSNQWVSKDLRRTMREKIQQQIESRWKSCSTQGGKFIAQTENFGQYLKQRTNRKKKRIAAEHPEALVKVVTQVHTQPPVKQIQREGGGCKFCRWVRDKPNVKRDQKHEAGCELEEGRER